MNQLAAWLSNTAVLTVKLRHASASSRLFTSLSRSFRSQRMGKFG